jgi:Fe-Mn family superoxide dismutase
MKMLQQKLSKRTFLGYLAALPIGLTALKFAGHGIFIPAAHAAEGTATAGPFTLPALPYPTGALSKAIDKQTMEIHHGKHHQSYVDNLNKEIAKDAALKEKSIEDVIGAVSKYPAAIRNNAGGHWNHSFFWTIMTPDTTKPSAEFSSAIDSTFGSMDDFKKKFEESGTKQFGSGWVWLIVNKGGKLEITTTPNQDNPLMDDAKVKGTPILGNDVWEHAYYLRYQNKRADYLKSWWNVVNWARVSELYEQGKSV